MPNTAFPPPSLTFCKQSFNAYKNGILKEYGLHVGKDVMLSGYKEVFENTNKSMREILDEASYKREDIIDYASVIDEKVYMEYDKNGEAFSLDDFPSGEVKYCFNSRK